MTASDTAQGLIVEIVDSIAIIRFDRPAKRNSLSQDLLDRLEKALSACLSRDDIVALIFIGIGDVFASGADILELSGLNPESALAFSQRGQKIFQMIAVAPQITIAAINGYCMGGALDLVLACDIRIASSKAIFAHPGAKLGIITGWGGTQRLPLLIGKTRALEFFITARRIASDEALEIGLVSEVHDPVLDRAMELASITKK